MEDLSTRPHFPLWLFIVYVPLLILMIAAMWKVYTKAGQPGWACIVPIYNIVVLLRIVGKPWWWLLLMLTPVVSIPFVVISPLLFGVLYFATLILTMIYVIWMYNMLSKSFGKSEGFTVGLIFLGFIFFPILGFGSAEYQGPYGDPQAFAAFKHGAFDFEQNKLHE